MSSQERLNLKQADKIHEHKVAFLSSVEKIKERAIQDLARELYLDPETVREYWDAI